MKENWPFHDESSGYKIQEFLYYGFGDSGSIAAADCQTSQECVEKLKRDWGYDAEAIGLYPQNLGEMAVTVLTGRQFVDRLKQICAEDRKMGYDHTLRTYGHWEGQA